MAASDVEVVVVGGGMAGVSAGARIAEHASVCVLEAERAAGYHATGRSAAALQQSLPGSYGGPVMRGLIDLSRRFLEAPPAGMPGPLVTPMPFLQFARPGRGTVARELFAEVSRRLPDLRLLDADEVVEVCPVLRPGVAEAAVYEPGAVSIDVDALLALFARMLKDRGGRLVTGARVTGLERVRRVWRVTTSGGEEFRAGVVVDAAGPWADPVAELAGVRPLGIRPLLRSAFTVASPLGDATRGLPMTADLDEGIYFEPEGDALMCSPADETPSEPCDAKPDELEIARALDELHELTTVTARHVGSTWGGLRSFAPDRAPVVGFDEDVPGFFWLAGQGGCGIMTAPALSELVAHLVTGRPAPAGLAEAGVDPALLAPGRLG